MTSLANIDTVAAVAQLQASFAAQQAGIAQAAAASILTAPASWTPTDASGASITFVSATGQWYTVGHLVVAQLAITYPGAVVSTAAAIIGGLPVPVPNNTFATSVAICAVTNMGSPTGVALVAVQNSSYASCYNPVAQANIENVSLSGATIKCTLIYSAL